MDSFGTAALRDRVLATWTAAPSRFREDANAEDELARGAYRDRVIVELAQNAADAAARVGVQGRLLLRLVGSTLTAANTGASLDAAGVEGLSTLRASAKRDERASVGRFGVGFASVLAVTDEPAIHSRDGGVRWSRDEAATIVGGVRQLAEEADRRGRSVPVLRLPFAAAGAVPVGYDTVVVLPLRDEPAVALVRDLLAGVDDALMLALPALGEVVVDVDGVTRTWRAETLPPPELDSVHDTTIGERRVGERRWRIAERAGAAGAELLADRPHEERLRARWSVVLAVPVAGADREPTAPAAVPESIPGVVHAPTPTDDRLDLPVLLIATFPMDSARRRVAPGPLTDHLVQQIGRAYADLVASFDSAAALDLVPGLLGVDELDAAVHRAVFAELAGTPLVRTAQGARLRPRDVVLVDGLRLAADPSALGDVMAGLPAPEWWRPDPLRRLGVREVPLADLVDELASLRLEPARWRELYAALDGADREGLGALPVPLADGRLVRGPRGLLLPTGVTAADLDAFDLRVVAVEAVHPLLRRLGAVEASPGSVLRDPMVRAAVGAATEDDDPLPAAEAVLRLVAATGLTHEEEPWLSGLRLIDRTGHPAPAADLVLPGSPVLELLDVDPDEFTVAADLVSRHGMDVLRAVGVRDGLGTLHDADAALDDHFWHDLDDEESWIEAVLDELPEAEVPPVVADFVAVRDLDLIRDDAWPAALGRLAGDQATHAAVVEPAYLVDPAGSRVAVPSYTAWWLREHVRIESLRLDQICAAGAEPAARALLHPVDLDLDARFAAAIGLVRRLGDADGAALLDRLADPSVQLPAGTLSEIYAELAGRSPASVPPPVRLRVPDGLGSRVVDAADVVVVDAPYWLQLGLTAAIPGPAALADVLDVDLASEAFHSRPEGTGRTNSVPGVVGGMLPDAPSTYVEHDDLLVDGHPVQWWVDGDVVHAATTDGLARGLAWVAGRWRLRWQVAELLREPTSAATLLAEESFE